METNPKREPRDQVAVRFPKSLVARLDRFAVRHSLPRAGAASYLLSDALHRKGFPMLAEDELDGPPNRTAGPA